MFQGAYSLPRKHDILEASWPDSCGMDESGNRLMSAARGGCGKCLGYDGTFRMVKLQ